MDILQSIGTTPTINKLKSMIELHKKCRQLVEEGKIDSKYEKDIETRVRNSPLLAGWMLGMALYTKLLGDIPSKIENNFHKDNTDKER